MRIDFIAERIHFFDHAYPIWRKLPAENRGTFYIPGDLLELLWKERGFEGIRLPMNGQYMNLPSNGNAVLCASYGSLRMVCEMERTFRHFPPRKKILMEHGVGFSFSNTNPSYAGGTGERKNVDLFLAPNHYVEQKNLETYKTIPNVIIGCPKMDKWKDFQFEKHDEPVIAISFHWDAQVSPETTSAWLFFKDALPKIAKRWKVIGHAHPRWAALLEAEYRKMGIEFVKDFDEVLRRADVYVNDSSSTLYEFAATDRPVVVLDSPKYRRGVNHGLRFWEHADVGVRIRDRDLLEQAIEEALHDSPAQKEKRLKAKEEVFPVWGNSSELAVKEILDFLKNGATAGKVYAELGEKTMGIVYMSFGQNAAKDIHGSILSMHKLGYHIPCTAIGDTPVPGIDFIEWRGQSPFDKSCRQNFQFRAGRIKPGLYDHTPYDLTLYIDADTNFIGNIKPGFEYLLEHDLAVTQETLQICQLYNKPKAGWEINIRERDQTIHEIGRGDINFWNSGVLFFRKSEATKRVFAAWYDEWMRFQQWDEQLALMRAILKNDPIIKVLPIGWNAPHREWATHIYHWYGRGTSRTNV